MKASDKRRQIFTDIYEHHTWGGVSRSGTGSDLEQTGVVRAELPKLLRQLNVKSILDIPCGDLNWMSKVALPDDITYIGADIVPEIIKRNQQLNMGDRFSFEVLDVCTDLLPKTDLVFVRDLFGHLTDAEVGEAVENIKLSGATWMIATTFPKVKQNAEIETGKWRPINMDLFDIRLVMLMDERLINQYGENVGKMLGVYRLKF